MLSALSIRDIVLIDKLDLEFGPGLCALTGETGAGKSILLDAFTLAIGGRGDASLVRRGASQGQVTAIFELPPDHPVLRAPGRQRHRGRGGSDPAARAVRRRPHAAPSSTTSPWACSCCARWARRLVEIHGQHDDRALIDPSRPSRPGRCLWRLERRGRRGRRQPGTLGSHAEAERARHAGEIAAIRANADYVSHALDELRRLDPQAGEEEALAARRQLMMHAEKIAGELNEALDALAGRGDRWRAPCRGAAPDRAPGRRRRRVARLRGRGARARADRDRRRPRQDRGGACRHRLRAARSSSAPRSGCSRSARSPASTGSASTICRRCVARLETELAALDHERDAGSRSWPAGAQPAREVYDDCAPAL